jgi:hypothetical protein
MKMPRCPGEKLRPLPFRRFGNPSRKEAKVNAMFNTTPAHTKSYNQTDGKAKAEAGGQPCSVCQREYVIPRTEWMEWWDFTPCENGMPSRKEAKVNAMFNTTPAHTKSYNQTDGKAKAEASLYASEST